jgi:protein-S-isoprenylcysteine O-methyltransferase Ste14
MDGPYRWVRHPSEAGTLLIALGLSALTASPAALGLTLGLLAPLVLIRCRREDLGSRPRFRAGRGGLRLRLRWCRGDRLT